MSKLSKILGSISAHLPTPPLTQRESIDNKQGLMLGSGRGRWAVAQILILIQILYVQAIFEVFSLPFLHATPCQHFIKHLCKLRSDAPILCQRSVENLGVKRNSCWRKLQRMIL